METLKYKIGFLIACIFIGFVIYINSGTPKEDINPKELALSNIEKIEINKLKGSKIITIRDTSEIKPLINQLLKLKKAKIENPRNSESIYYCRIYFADSTSELIGFKEHRFLGRFLFYKTGNFKNDSLFKIIENTYR
jgi:hypothetical protein